MADEKPVEGQNADVLTLEPQTVEMTREELESKIGSDLKFANDYLEGRIKVESTDPDKQEPEAPKPESVKPEPAPQAAVTPVPAPAAATPVSSEKKDEKPVETDDGKFVVEFEDGRKLAYKSKNEALKAIREKENYILRQKNMLDELKGRERELSDKLKILESQKPQPPQALKTEAPAPKTDKATEVLDPLDPDYHNQLQAKHEAQEQRIAQLEAELKKDRDEWKQYQADLKKRDEDRKLEEQQKQALQEHYSEANLFVGRHPEFKLDKPINVINDEYRSFLKDLGMLAGSDGSQSQNLAIFELYLDESNEKGKAWKAEAEKVGIRPPAELDNYFKVLNLFKSRDGFKKKDAVTGKEVPFTLEETYRYLQSQNADQVPAIPPAADPQANQPQKSEQVPISPRAQAFAAADALAKQVASDLPAGKGSAPVDISQMSQQQLEEVLDWPLSVPRSDPVKRAIWEAAFKLAKVVPPRLDG
jgi:hypothetical protein